MLCSDTNRIPLPGSPSTCALDTSITPLPSFILLGFLVLYVPIRIFRTRRISASSSTTVSMTKPSKSARWPHTDADAYTYTSPAESPPRHFSPSNSDSNISRLSSVPLFPKWVDCIYVGLAVCLLGLRVLEVARLVAAGMGVGLLPVGVVANLVNIVMLLGVWGCLEFLTKIGMGRSRSLGVSASLVLYWASSTILETVKVARLSSYNSIHPAKGTAYPSSDWLLDNGCMLGLFVVFFIVEGTYLVLLYRSQHLPLTDCESDSYARPTPEPGSIRDKGISDPRPMSAYEYDPVSFVEARGGRSAAV